MCRVTHHLQKHAGLLFRVGLSVGLMTWLLSKQDLGKLWESCRDFQVWGWPAAVISLVVSHLILGYRWYGLAQGLGVPGSLPRFWRLHFEGLFFSQCLPSSIGGDVVKVVRSAADTSTRIKAGYSVVADRLCGLCAVLIIGLAALVGKLQDFPPLFTLGLSCCFFAIAAVAMLLGLKLLRNVMQRGSVQGRLYKTFEPLLAFCDCPAVLLRGLIWALAVQLSCIVTLWILGTALGLPVGFAAYCTVAPLTALATTLPISMNGVGVREQAMVSLMAHYGVAAETATALSLIWFAIVVIGGVIGGLIYGFAPPLSTGAQAAAEPAAIHREPRFAGNPQPVESLIAG